MNECLQNTKLPIWRKLDTTTLKIQIEELVNNWLDLNNPDIFRIIGTNEDLEITTFKLDK